MERKKKLAGKVVIKNVKAAQGKLLQKWLIG